MGTEYSELQELYTTRDALLDALNKIERKYVGAYNEAQERNPDGTFAGSGSGDSDAGNNWIVNPNLKTESEKGLVQVLNSTRNKIQDVVAKNPKKFTVEVKKKINDFFETIDSILNPKKESPLHYTKKVYNQGKSTKTPILSTTQRFYDFKGKSSASLDITGDESIAELVMKIEELLAEVEATAKSELQSE